MAPATIAGAALHARKGGGAGWDRDTIIIAIQEWVATYGEPPRAADWNPSSAKWSGQPWRVERYRAGRADGSRWPALNSAKRPFGGSLNAAIRAAGFEPAKPGPTRRTDVDPEQAHRAQMSPEGRAMLAAALAQSRAAQRRVAVLEARLERAGGDAALAPARRQVAARDDEALRAARGQLVESRMDAAEARTAAKRMAAKLERAEATVGSLRVERRELRETAAAIRGEARKLTATEFAELRTRGASGPAVMAEALNALAAARRTNNPTRMHDALRRVAQAAVTWQERI